MKQASLIPYVCGAGASTPGAERAALYCFDQGLDEASGLDWLLNPYEHWRGEFGEKAHLGLPPRGDPVRQQIVQWHIEQLALNVERTIRSGQRAITLGGDHSLSAGSIAGARRAIPVSERCGLLWIDAHTDIHTFASSGSKALHGMPVGSLLGLDRTLVVPGCSYPVIAPEDVIYAGLRSVDDGEIVNAAALGIPVPNIADLRQAGVVKDLTAKISALASRCDHIFLSIDLDAFSAKIAPSVGTPVDDGFEYDEIVPLLADFVKTYSVPLIDIVEFNPTLAAPEKTLALITRLLEDLQPRDSIDA